MKHFALILLAALTWSVNAQITYPFNPDGNGDQYIATVDLQDFLVHYGQEFEPGELLVDSCAVVGLLKRWRLGPTWGSFGAGKTPSGCLGCFLSWRSEDETAH